MTEAVRYPNIHNLVYAESGAGKSTYWATLIAYYAKHFNEPSLVFFFDPPDMATPYRDLGTTSAYQPQDTGDKFYENLGIQVEDVRDSNGNLIVRIEFYCDTDPENPSAHNKFERRLMGFYEEAKGWASVAVDSMTHYQHSALMRAKKELNFKLFEAGKDGRQPYGLVAENVAIFMFSRAAHWKTNVGILCHVDENKESYGELGILQTVALQGKMSKRAPSGFGEVYHLRVLPEKGKDSSTYRRELQTVSDDKWMGKHTVTKAPNPCAPTYEALWENWRRQ